MFSVSLLNILQSLIYKYIFQVKGGAMEGSAQKFNFSPTSVIWGYMNEVCKVKEVSKFQKEMASPITSFRALLDLWLLKEDKWRSSNEHCCYVAGSMQFETCYYCIYYRSLVKILGNPQAANLSEGAFTQYLLRPVTLKWQPRVRGQVRNPDNVTGAFRHRAQRSVHINNSIDKLPGFCSN